MRYPWRRLAAWLIDWACILGWVVATAAVGVPLYLSGVTVGMSPVVQNLLGAVVVVLPVVLASAWFESRARAGTPGKRVLGLRVQLAGAVPVYGRALVRNALKLGLPWSVGHAAVFAIVGTEPDAPVPASVWVLTAVAYVLPLSYLVALFLPAGRTPYDLAARTRVVRTGASPT